MPIGLVVSDPNAQFGYTLLATCVATFAGGSIGSLLDAIVVEQVPKNAYGRLRLWCAVGYGGAAGVVGVAMNFVHEDKSRRWLPYLTHFAPGILSALIAMILMLLMPSKKEKQEENSDEQSPPAPILVHETSKLTIQRQTEDTEIEDESHGVILVPKEEESPSFLDQISKVPKTIDMFLFVMVILLCGCCMGLVATFLFIFIETDLGGSQLVMGVSVLVTCAAEVPVFYFSEYLLNRWPADWTLVISLFAYVVRFGLYWFLAAYKMNAWCILLPEVMHGFTFALMWCSAVAKATETISGYALTNFAVGFITAVLTCGNAMGGLIAGAMLRQGVSMLWVWQGSTYMMMFWTVVWTAKSFLEWYTKKEM